MTVDRRRSDVKVVGPGDRHTHGRSYSGVARSAAAVSPTISTGTASPSVQARMTAPSVGSWLDWPLTGSYVNWLIIAYRAYRWVSEIAAVHMEYSGWADDLLRRWTARTAASPS